MYSTSEELARKAYNQINGKASSNIFTQGISGFLGFPFTLIIDVAVIGTHYVPMFNNIRSIYNRSPVTDNVVAPMLTNISSEILFDIVADKVLGNVPIIGIYFNAICAKTMTWRLGILFSMLASRGESIKPESIRDAMIVIRQVFPQKSSFSFKQPSLDEFVKIVSSVYENSQQEYESKIHRAMDIFNQ